MVYSNSPNYLFTIIFKIIDQVTFLIQIAFKLPNQHVKL
jgi:hypothetical protein